MRKTLLLFTTMALALLLAAGMAGAALPAPTVVGYGVGTATVPPTTPPNRRGPQRQHHGDVLRGDELEEPPDLQPLHHHFLVQYLLPPAGGPLHRPEAK